MPLLPGKENIGHNIEEMEASGHPHKQAVAAAMHKAGVAQEARGAAVVNNQYYAPGRFIAKALESIESAVYRRRQKKQQPVSMAAGYGSATNDLPVSLARKDFYTPFGHYVAHIHEPTHPETGLHILAFDKSRVGDSDHNPIIKLTNESGPAGAYLFHHVGKFVDDFIHHKRPGKLMFSADLREPKRVKVYDQLAKLLAAKHGYHLSQTDDRTIEDEPERQYTLHKNMPDPRFHKVVPLARFDKLPVSRLTPEDVKNIEDAHGKNPPRLPYTVRPDGTIQTNVHELHDWFDKIGGRQGKLPKGAKAQLAFLTTHFGEAAKQIPDEGWYGEKTKEMEEGFKKAFPQVHPKVAKILTAVTSPGQRPVQNIDTVFKILKAGHKRNPLSPVDAMPTHDIDSFEEWKKREKPDEPALHPGFESHNLGWSTVYRGKNPGYSEAQWLFNKATGKVEKRLPTGDPVPHGYTTIKLPSPDAEGKLRPKGWGARTSIAKHIEKIRTMHNEMGPEKFVHWLDNGGAETFGPKVGNFYKNLNGQNEHVTKDVWMTRTFRRLLRKLGKSKDAAPSPKENKLIDHAMSETAKKVGTSPSTLQALLWYYEQNLHRVFGTHAPSQDFAQGMREAIKKHGLPGRGD